jgi:hypothetical protein
MIAYEELAAALERWRVRNGHPATPPLFSDVPATPGFEPISTVQAVAPAPRRPEPAAVIVAAPPPQRAAAPPPPPGGRTIQFGIAAPTVVAAPPTLAMPAIEADTADLGDADMLVEAAVEDSVDQYDNEGNDFAMAFGATASGAIGEEVEPTRVSGDAGSSADGWPEANTVSTYGWGQPAPAAAPVVVVDDAEGEIVSEADVEDESTHIGQPGRRN